MLTTEQIEKAKTILSPYGYIVGKTPADFLVCRQNRRKIIRIVYINSDEAFFIHTVSSDWPYDEFKREAEEALKLMEQLKMAGLPIVKE